jgi:iron-sulfur cluster repair protein YtfE (RIC family)
MAMQAIQFLKQEHGKAKAAFQEIETAPTSRRGALWEKLRPELEMHEKKEETYVYGPATRDAQADQSLKEWQATHHREVQEAEGLIKTISHLDPTDAEWLETVKKLRGALEQHIRKEEQEIWPKIELAWGPARLESAGSQMAAMTRGETAAAR